MSPPIPVLVYNQSPDDPLDAEQVAAWLGICVGSAYELVKHVASIRAPGVGLRYRRSDILAYLYRREHWRRPKSQPPVAPKKPGTRRAKRADEEVVPGLTSEQLRDKAGF